MSYDVEEVLSVQEGMEADRTVFEAHWRQVSEYIAPDYLEPFQNPTMMGMQKGEKNTDKLVDTTAVTGLRTLTSVYESFLTPFGQRWHSLTSSGIDGEEVDPEVQDWFDRSTGILFRYRYAPLGNFPHQLHEIYRIGGAFGTAVLFVDGYDGGEGLRYRALHPMEAYIEENHQGVVDRVHRRFVLTARQAVAQFGPRCSAQIQQAAGNPVQRNREFTFIHCVKPDAPSGGSGYESFYVERDTKSLVGAARYFSMPYIVFRGSVAPGEVYGRSPGMAALPDVKTANEILRTLLKQGQRAVDPIMLVADDGIMDSLSLIPGSMVPGGIGPDGRPLVQVLPVGNLAVGERLLELVQARIADVFYVPLFRALEETKRMTATEVSERMREKADMLGPVVGRQQTEFLGPLIRRELDILERQGKLPRVPPGLARAGGEFSVRFESPLSRALMSESSGGILRTLETALQLASVSGPEVFDAFDMDQIVQFIARANAVPGQFLRRPDQIQGLRQGRDQQAQVAQVAELAPGTADMIKALKS